MPDPTPKPPSSPTIPAEIPPSAAPVVTQPPALNLGPGVGINVTQDMATAERKLPPAKIVLIVLAALAVVLVIYGFLGRAKPQGAGSIDNIAAIEVPNQNSMLVAITVTLHNSGEKPLWIHTVQGKLKTSPNSDPGKPNSAAAEYSDDAASAVDFDRYFQAFPTLKQNAKAALMPETKILPGNEAHGTVIVSFPITQDVFDKRQSISVVIQPYDQPLPVTLTR
ncbi:MAG: hypothetical protein WA628_04460 [Terriglobales bacterium]